MYVPVLYTGIAFEAYMSSVEMEVMKACVWGRGGTWMYCLQCSCRELWGDGVKSRLVWVSHTEQTQSDRLQKQRGLSLWMSLTVVWCITPNNHGRLDGEFWWVRPLLQLYCHGRGASEGKRAFVGTCACSCHGHKKTFTSFWVSHRSAVS